ncbi:non-ribosomal peptide synthetase [Methylocapsa palsarum]|uniref:Amino acid adenylation domain-containing protein n=1 Tax=Methylocapsa palsarum TaxID=1612308 RepID=A0A1I4AP63_9HYPH|nr:non-ribosomal peptide synthetase [Methylocapsa palsarum]SFK58154.1 amino acid adenylation domain-containing protein [Methylocapsa palsarum]
MRLLAEEASSPGPRAGDPSDVVSLLRSRAGDDERAGFVFLSDGETESASLTFGQLDLHARAIAVRLLEAARPGDRALLLYPPGLDFISAFFGCLYAGIVAVPAYPPSRRRLEGARPIVQDCAPALVLTTEALREEYSRLGAQAWAREDLVWISTDRMDLDAAALWTPSDIRPDSIAFLQYTSGSTGKPKGVMVSHGNLIANEAAIKGAFAHDSAPVVVGWLPLYHDMGLIGNVLQPLYAAGTAVLMPPLAFLEKPLRWLEAISAYRAHTSGGPNFAYELCLRKISPKDRRGLDLTSWAVAFNGSEPVRASTLDRFAAAFAECGFSSASFYPCYGLAEATLFVSGPARGCAPHVEGFDKAALAQGAAVVAPGSVEERTALVGCGHGAPGHEVKIVDPDTLIDCAEGRVGEIWLAGPSVAQGYFGQTALSEEVFRARAAAGDGTFLRTGDLGFKSGASLFIAGRIKDLIIVRGANYYAADFERVLDHVEGLRSGCNAAFSADIGGEEKLILVAEAQRDSFRSRGPASIFQAIREAIASEYDLEIGEIVLTNPGAVPKTTSGKVRRRACREAYLAGALQILARRGIEPAAEGLEPGQDSSGRPPQKSPPEIIERILRTEAARLLRCAAAHIPASASLGELGLDSMRVIELKHAVEAALPINLPLAMLMSEKPIGAVALEIAALEFAAPATRSATPSPPREAQVQSSPREAQDLFPPGEAQDLSQTQRAHWTAHNLDTESISYNLHLALDVAGDLDCDRLVAAIARVMERHEQLRAVYRFEDGAVRQSAEPLANLPQWFAFLDASGWTDAAVQADMSRRTRRPFDLEKGPLVRLSAYRLAQDRMRLLFCAHHIAVDLWSLVLLIKELDETYHDFAAVQAPQGLGYADFTRSQQAYLKSPLAVRDWNYWRSRLGGPLPVLALPADFPLHTVHQYRGGSKSLRLGPDLTTKLRTLARSQGVSLFAVLLAAYQVLLQRYSGQEEIVVGVPTSGRLESGFSGLIGNFVNPAPILGRPQAAQPFADFLRQLGADLREALIHQAFPFPELVERLKPERHGDHWPVFQTSFAFQQARSDLSPGLAALALGEEGDAFSWCGCAAAPLPLAERVENFDLKLMAAETQDGLIFSFQYRADLFSPATIARLSDHFSRLLEALVVSPSARIGSLPLLSEKERAEAIYGFNATAAAYPGGCLHELFSAQARRRPDAVAVCFGERRLSYGALDALSNQLAHRLRDVGIGPERVVGLCLERSLALVVAILGVWKAGGAYLPLDPTYPRERLALMAGDAKPSLIVTTAALSELLPESAARLCLDDDFAALEEMRTDAPPFAALPQNLAYVIYTSGSTGRPKGVAVAHGGVVNRLAWMQERYRLGEADAVLQKTPFGFDVSVWELIWPLVSGARLVLARPGEHGDPAHLAEVIRRERVSVAHFVPAMLQAFLQAFPEAPDVPALPGLRHVICSGEALSVRLRDQFHALQSAELHNLYGPTEASIDVTAHACARAKEAGAKAEAGAEAGVPIGRPIWNTQIYILDAALELAPVGVAGELYIGGVGLARGYLGRPDLTAERFAPDPFGPPGGRLYRTGDLCRRRADGEIDFLGRIDHQVKIRGHRIELGEIEAVLADAAGVRQAVAVVRADSARDDAAGSKTLIAYVAGEDAAALDPARLRTYLSGRLPDYMVPSLFVRVDGFALTPSGKIDRNALPAPGVSGATSGYAPPQTPAEEILARIWSEVLGLEQVGTQDNFFALGGDSILSIQVASRARQKGFELTPRQIFLNPSISALAPLLQKSVDSPPGQTALAADSFSLAELSSEQVDGLKAEFPGLVDLYPLTSLQEGMLFHSLLNPGSGVYVMQDQYEIRGSVDVDAFQKAWQSTVDRHEILRSGLAWRQIEKPHQLVRNEAVLPFSLFDWRDLSDDEREGRLNEILAAEQRDGFDLEKPPLMRIRLFRFGEERWRCVRSHHHILTDEWCTSPLLMEFRDAYAALTEKRPLPQRPAPQFKTYIGWLKRQDLASTEAFFRTCLAGFREPTPLTIERRAPGSGSGAVRDAQGSLSREQTLALQGIARQHGLTPNTLIQAAFALLIGRYANRREVVFGITVSGRPAALPGIEETLGLFINTLPLRLALRDEQKVCDWWREIQARNLEARQFEHAPLVEIKAWSDVPQGADLFQHLFVYENAPIDRSLLEDHSVLDMRFADNRVHTNYPITATIIPNERLTVRITYDAAKFESASIDRMLGHFLTLIESMLARPDARLGELGLGGPIERRRALEEWNDVTCAYPAPADFVAGFEAQANKSPAAPAVRCGAASLSYSELDRRADEASRGLIALGAGPEVIVAVLDQRGIDYLVILLAVLKAGAVYLPLDPRHPRLRRLTIIEESGADLVVCGQAWLPEFEPRRAGAAKAVTLAEIEAAAAARATESRSVPCVEARNLAYIIYTSGSTGSPKGAMVERLGMFNNLMTKIPALGLGPDDVIAQTAPQAFDISVWQFLTALLCGACVDILPDAVAQDPAALRCALRDRGITILESVPSMIAAMLDGLESSARPQQLRWLLPTGEALTPELCRRWFEHYPATPMLNAYGPAECADDVAYHRIEAAPDASVTTIPIGRPAANLRLYILDRCLHHSPVGVPGQLAVAGMGVGRGYAGRPDLTAASFAPDPFGPPGDRLYLTGDIARYRDDGTIEFLGRSDHQVKILGHRIEIGEIEAQLERHPDLKEAAVAAWREGGAGARLVGYFVPRERGEIQPEELRVFLRERLPDYMVPAIWIELDALPLNQNGKLDRNSLPDPKPRDIASSDAPASPTEEIVAAIWAGLLAREHLARQDNFFELGGHSLLATQAVARINQAFAIEAPLRAIFEAPTIAALAARIDIARAQAFEPAAPVLKAPRDAPSPLSHAQERLWFMQQLDPGNPFYHFAVAVRVAGPIDAAALEASLNAIVQRHDSLRTVFQEEYGRVTQRVRAEERLTLAKEELEEATSDAAFAELHRRLNARIAEPFDLEHGPLMRARLYRISPARDGAAPVCAVLLCFHHIVFDGWSFGVFLKEFAALYPAFATGGAPSLEPVAHQYPDYAVWQRKQMESDIPARQLDYWMTQLTGAPPTLDLPFDQPRGDGAGDAAATHDLDLGALRDAFDTFNRKHAVTPFMTMLSVLATFLHALTGADDLVVGADVANRRRREFEPIVGFFINLVALRIRLARDPSFTQILARVRHVVLGAYDHQELPFAKLVEALKPERSPFHAPVFQVKLVFHNVPLAELSLPGLTFEAIPLEPARAELDLVLHVYEDGKGLRVVFEYRSGLFAAESIARFSELFQLLLTRVLAEPSLDLKALAGIVEERDRALRSEARAGRAASLTDHLRVAKRRAAPAGGK